MSEENKALHRYICEQLWEEGNLGVIDKILIDDYVGNQWPSLPAAGPRGSQVVHRYGNERLLERRRYD